MAVEVPEKVHQFENAVSRPEEENFKKICKDHGKIELTS